MKLFISYSSTRSGLAEQLRLALEAEGHQVFTDRADLRPGDSFHAPLRDAIEAADRFIFLVSPESVAPGSYALAELSVAQQRWRRPAGHVLPVVVAPTERAAIPPYLTAVTLFQPQGDLVAETVTEVARMAPRRGRTLGVALALLVVLGAALAAAWTYHDRRQQAEVQAQWQQIRQQLAAAAQLCASGNRALAWRQFEAIAAPGGDPAADTEVATAREDCAMRWLRQASITTGKETFGELADRLQPTLARGLSGASGRRAADLRAHLAWADFLRSRDGVIATPQIPQYEQAVRDDPTNVYAHSMWAHRLMWGATAQAGEADGHFALALRDGRDRAYVREMQFAAFLDRSDTEDRAFVIADAMRRNGETLGSALRWRLWRDRIPLALRQPARRAATLAALPAADWLATYRWLAPPEAVLDDDPAARFAMALLQANAGDEAAARAGLQALRQDPATRLTTYADEAGRVLQAWTKASLQSGKADSPKR
ncbi:MAG: toll/interleukin-1 receptor domain-containing protein [Burkholderiaceae bacterium]